MNINASRGVKQLAALTILAALAAGASAADAAVGAASAACTPDAHFSLLDADGRIAGEAVCERSGQLRVQVIGVTRAIGRSIQAEAESRAARTFRPDFSRTLTPGQLDVAWHAELDRLFPPVMTGG